MNRGEFGCAVNRSIRIYGSNRTVSREITPQRPDSRPLTMPRATARKNPRSEKYTTNAGLLNKTSRSSRECVGSGTIPNIAISTAPPAMRIVPRTIQAENTSPRSRRAKKAFHNNDTAPSGARMTTGSDAIWNSEPRMFEDMNMPIAEGVQQHGS